MSEDHGKIAREVYLEGISSRELQIEMLQRAIKRTVSQQVEYAKAVQNLSAKLAYCEQMVDTMWKKLHAQQAELHRQLTKAKGDA